MKLNHQTQYFINGIILIIIALLSVTILPKSNLLSIPKYAYYQIEFFVLCAASIYFLFSPKYYKGQILTILLGIIYYILFVKFN